MFEVNYDGKKLVIYSELNPVDTLEKLQILKSEIGLEISRTVVRAMEYKINESKN